MAENILYVIKRIEKQPLQPSRKKYIQPLQVEVESFPGCNFVHPISDEETAEKVTTSYADRILNKGGGKTQQTPLY